MYKEKDFNISICSYNLFWKIMKNDSSPLAKNLGSDKLNKLKSNIIRNIILIKNYYNPFFYCFQEAENSENIINLFDNQEYNYHLGYSEPEYILTIWQKKIFEKIIGFDGEFEPGRPFTIFIFKDLRFGINFILINIHSGHDPDTANSIYKPVQDLIDSNKIKINKYVIERIIITGDFNRDIGSQIVIEPSKYKLNVNDKIFYFKSNLNTNKTCCSLKGYGYNKNYDQSIDSFKKPILIHQLSKESWYTSESSDHLAIISILKNFNK